MALDSLVYIKKIEIDYNLFTGINEQYGNVFISPVIANVYIMGGFIQVVTNFAGAGVTIKNLFLNCVTPVNKSKTNIETLSSFRNNFSSVNIISYSICNNVIANNVIRLYIKASTGTLNNLTEGTANIYLFFNDI